MCAYLNINLYFGEHYYSGDSYSTWLSLIFTLIGAAFGAWLGFKLYIRQDKKLKINRLVSEKDYFIKNLKKAINFSKQQLEKYEETIATQKKDWYRHKKIERICFKNLIFISKLNTNSLFEAFSKQANLTTTDFFNIFLNTNHLQDIFDRVENMDYNNLLQYFQSVEKIEKRLIDIIIILKQRKNVLKKKNKNNSDEFFLIDSLLLNLNNNDDIHNFSLIDNCLVKKICDKSDEDFFISEIWSEIYRKCKEIRYWIRKIKANNEKSNQLLAETIKSLNEDLRDLNILSNRIIE